MNRFEQITMDLFGAPPQDGMTVEELNRFYDAWIDRQEHDRVCRIARAEVDGFEPDPTLDLL